MRRDQGQGTRVLGVLLAVAFAVGCASNREPPATDLYFIDVQGFDAQLHRSLAREYERVTVTFIGDDATLSSMPDRIEHWLAVVANEDEERVRYLPDPRYPVEKAIPFGAIIPLAIAAYGKISNYLFYAPVRDYEAVVYYVPKTGGLTRVVFHRVYE